MKEGSKDDEDINRQEIDSMVLRTFYRFIIGSRVNLHRTLIKNADLSPSKTGSPLPAHDVAQSGIPLHY